jgi:hypothetical protein
VLLLKLLRNESIEMSFPKSDSPTEFHEFNLSIADPMPQRSFRNAQVRRCFRGTIGRRHESSFWTVRGKVHRLTAAILSYARTPAAPKSFFF